MPAVPRPASHRSSVVRLVALAVFTVGCRTAAVAGDGAGGTEHRRAILAADSAFGAAAVARDLEASAASLTSDAVMFPPDGPPVVGRAAIREYMRGAFATPGFSVQWTTDTVVVARSGDLAYSFGRSRYTFPARSGSPGALDTAYAKAVNVWRRDADGRWRALMDMGAAANDLLGGPPPATPATAPAQPPPNSPPASR